MKKKIYFSQKIFLEMSREWKNFQKFPENPRKDEFLQKQFTKIVASQQLRCM